MIGSHIACDPIIFMCEFNGKKRSVRDYFPKPLLLRNTGASCGVVDSVPSLVVHAIDGPLMYSDDQFVYKFRYIK